MWIVDVKGGEPGTREVEVSAVDENNKHGRLSWGWHDEDKKIVVLRVSSLYQKYPIHPDVIASAISVAKCVCEQKNNEVMTNEK